MTVLHHSLSANCRPEALWQELSDLEAVGRHNPTVRQARVTGSVQRGIGALRECDLVPKGKVIERVIHWDDGHSLGLEVVESDWPVRSMRWITRIEPNGSGSTLSQRLEYEMKFGPLGWFLNAVVMRRAINKNVGLALGNLVALAEKSAS
jgi:Polyketide cyclase / dehydrase and lipid transport